MDNIDIAYLYVTKSTLNLENSSAFEIVSKSKLNYILKISLIFKDYWATQQHLYILYREFAFKGEDALYEILNRLKMLNVNLDEYFILKNIFSNCFSRQLTERQFFAIIKGLRDSSFISNINDVDTIQSLLNNYINFVKSIPFSEDLIHSIVSDCKLFSTFMDSNISNIEKSLISVLAQHVNYIDTSDLFLLLNCCITKNIQCKSLMGYLYDNYTVSTDSNIDCHYVDSKHNSEYIYMKCINTLLVLIEEVLYVFNL